MISGWNDFRWMHRTIAQGPQFKLCSLNQIVLASIRLHLYDRNQAISSAVRKAAMGRQPTVGIQSLRKRCPHTPYKPLAVVIPLTTDP
jgi:hypothetical protein